MEKTQNFAKALKQLRKSKGITLDQISDSTKIKVQYLQKIESGNFSFKSDVYIRLFIKEYLKVVDIDNSDTIMSEFKNLFLSSSEINLTFEPIEQDNSDFVENIFSKDEYDPKKIGTIILIIIIIIAAYQFFEYAIN